MSVGSCSVLLSLRRWQSATTGGVENAARSRTQLRAAANLRPGGALLCSTNRIRRTSLMLMVCLSWLSLSDRLAAWPLIRPTPPGLTSFSSFLTKGNGGKTTRAPQALRIVPLIATAISSSRNGWLNVSHTIASNGWPDLSIQDVAPPVSSIEVGECTLVTDCETMSLSTLTGAVLALGRIIAARF
jgi:hypothetical protein